MRQIQNHRAIILLGLFALTIGCAKKVPSEHSNYALPKVISINACTDQLVLALAERDQIISLSHYASDSFSSPIAREAKKFPKNYMSAEEILQPKPDIVFSSPFEKPAINQIAKSLDIRIVYFGVPSNIEEAIGLVEMAGDALGQNARAENLKAQIIAATTPSKQKPVRALIYFQGGYSAGENTLIDEIMTRSGFYNMARDFGVGNWGKIDTEQIIANPPELMIIADTFANGALSERSMRHKALLRKELGIKFAHFPNQYSYCGGPLIIDIANHLKRIRGEYENH